MPKRSRDADNAVPDFDIVIHKMQHWLQDPRVTAELQAAIQNLRARPGSAFKIRKHSKPATQLPLGAAPAPSIAPPYSVFGFSHSETGEIIVLIPFKVLGQGGFGCVRKAMQVTITFSGDLQNPTTESVFNTDKFFAIKRNRLTGPSAIKWSVIKGVSESYGLPFFSGYRGDKKSTTVNIAQIQEPQISLNIVTFSAISTDYLAGGSTYYVMPAGEKASLLDDLKLFRQELEAFSEQVCWGIIPQQKKYIEQMLSLSLDAVLALRHLHDNGFSHGDYKPEHVIRAEKIPMVVDWDQADVFEKRHQPNELKGTPVYLSPKTTKYCAYLHQGKRVSHKDITLSDYRHKDIYALGVTLATICGFWKRVNVNAGLQKDNKNWAHINAVFSEHNAKETKRLRELLNNPEISPVMKAMLAIIVRCLNEDASQRPSVETVFADVQAVRDLYAPDLIKRDGSETQRPRPTDVSTAEKAQACCAEADTHLLRTSAPNVTEFASVQSVQEVNFLCCISQIVSGKFPEPAHTTPPRPHKLQRTFALARAEDSELPLGPRNLNAEFNRAIEELNTAIENEAPTLPSPSLTM